MKPQVVQESQKQNESISFEEMYNVFTRPEEKVPTEKVKQVFESSYQESVGKMLIAIDKNNDHYISENEFIQQFQKNPVPEFANPATCSSQKDAEEIIGPLTPLNQTSQDHKKRCAYIQQWNSNLKLLGQVTDVIQNGLGFTGNQKISIGKYCDAKIKYSGYSNANNFNLTKNGFVKQSPSSVKKETPKYTYDIYDENYDDYMDDQVEMFEDIRASLGNNYIKTAEKNLKISRYDLLTAKLEVYDSYYEDDRIYFEALQKYSKTLDGHAGNLVELENSMGRYDEWISLEDSNKHEDRLKNQQDKLNQDSFFYQDLANNNIGEDTFDEISSYETESILAEINELENEGVLDY